MSQEVQTTPTMNNGTSNKSPIPPAKGETPSIKRRGRPPKVETGGKQTKTTSALPPGVLGDYEKLDATVTAAKYNNENKVLVTSDILKRILGFHYKDANYMIYKNIELHDYEKVDQTMLKNAQKIEDRLFGNSQVGLTANLVNGKTTDE